MPQLRPDEDELYALIEANGYGTQGGTAIIERVMVTGFASGFRLGTATGIATCEVLFLDCKASYCNIGMELLDYNTLNILLNMWSIESCTVGVSTSQAGDVHVIGGSASGNKIDFELSTGGTNGRTNILLDSCEVMAPADYGNTTVISGSGGDSLTLISCFLNGFVSWYQGPYIQETLTMINTMILDGSESAPPPPFRLQVTAAPDSELFYRVMGCSWRAATHSGLPLDGYLSDQTGVVKDGKLVPTCQVDSLGKLTLSHLGVLTGSWTDGTAGRKLAAILAQIGLITNDTSEVTTVVAMVRGLMEAGQRE